METDASSSTTAWMDYIFGSPHENWSYSNISPSPWAKMGTADSSSSQLRSSHRDTSRFDQISASDRRMDTASFMSKLHNGRATSSQSSLGQTYNSAHRIPPSRPPVKMDTGTSSSSKLRDGHATFSEPSRHQTYPELGETKNKVYMFQSSIRPPRIPELPHRHQNPSASNYLVHADRPFLPPLDLKKRISGTSATVERCLPPSNPRPPPSGNTSMVNGIHDCYMNYELKSSAKLFSCDGCQTNGFGERYHCNLCGKELHRKCRFPNHTATHELLGCSPLTFHKRPLTQYNSKSRLTEYSKICNACGKEIRGFNYRYHSKNDSFDMHPNCLNLEKKVLVGEDMVLDLKPRVESKCMLCDKRKISDHRCPCAGGWSYISRCNKYHIHVHCMTELAHEACLRNAGGVTGLEEVELGTLVKKKGSSKTSAASRVFTIIKTILKIVFSALLGDPTMLISNAFVEFVSGGLQL